MRQLAVMALAAVACGAYAQSIMSFQPVSAIDDVTVLVSDGGLTYDVMVGPMPTFTYNSMTYAITEVFGFWLLSMDDDLTPQPADDGLWVGHMNNADMGGILGWKTNPNLGLTPGTSKTFELDSLNGTPEGFGFHVRIDGVIPWDPLGHDTGYITTLPEPATGLVLAPALLALAARRRTARKR